MQKWTKALKKMGITGGAILDNCMIAYLMYLMAIFLFDGEIATFLLSTIACGVWCISSSYHKNLLNKEKENEKSK